MARTVADAAWLLGAMTGLDPADEATGRSPDAMRADYTGSLDPAGLRGVRLGVARKMFGPNQASEKVMEEALAVMVDLGATLVDPAEVPGHGTFGGASYEVMLYEFKAGLNAYLAGLGPDAPVRSLRDVIEFNERHRDTELRWFGQETLMRAEAKGPLTDPAYLEALATCGRLSRKEGIDAVMDAHRLDALVAPTTGPAHVTDYVHGDRGTGSSTTAAAVAGYPSITVPAGRVHGLPVGVSFFGRAWSEPKFLGMAYAFEQATRVRRAPRYLKTVSEG
jgi:amidase